MCIEVAYIATFAIIVCHVVFRKKKTVRPVKLETAAFKSLSMIYDIKFNGRKIFECSVTKVWL